MREKDETHSNECGGEEYIHDMHQLLTLKAIDLRLYLCVVGIWTWRR